MNVAPDALAQTDESHRGPPPGTEEFPPPGDSTTPVETLDETVVLAQTPDERVEPTQAEPPAALPVTGGDIAALTAIGCGLVLAGFVVRGRRRPLAA